MSNSETFVILEDKENDIKVESEPRTSPFASRFFVNKKLHDSYSAYFGSKDAAKGSPLAEQLFAINGVMEAVISRYGVTVCAEPYSDWKAIEQSTAKVLCKQIAAGGNAIRPDFHEKMPSEQEICDEVTKILETQINPQISMHGGFIRLLNVQQNNIYLEMGGGCQGCAGARMTLKMGVEKVVREAIPAIGEVFDQTDHAQGANPYHPHD